MDRKSHPVAISLKFAGKSNRVAISDEITQNHTALLFQMKLLKIIPRCYFIWNYSKAHRVAISMKVHVRSKIQRVLKYNCIATSLLKIAKFKTKYQKKMYSILCL